MPYVYALLDSRKPGEFSYKNFSFNYEPFYIGLSTVDAYYRRMKDHLKIADEDEAEEMHPKLSKIRKMRREGFEPITVVVEDGIEKSQAVELEIALISAFGRACVEEGPLTNLSTGGEAGTAGCKFPNRPPISAETRDKISKTLRRYFENNPEVKAAHVADLHSPAALAAQAASIAARIGTHQSEAHVARRVATLKERHAKGEIRTTKGRSGEWHKTDEEKAAISARMKISAPLRVGTRGANWKGYLYSFELDCWWDTSQEAADDLGISIAALSMRVKSNPSFWRYVKFSNLLKITKAVPAN